MKNAIMIGLLAGIAALAQPALTEKTLTSAASATQAELYLATSGVSVGQYGYVDRELVRVREVGSGFIRVTRGVDGKTSAHASGVTVYFGSANQFTMQDPAGSCDAASIPATPYINIATGERFLCTSGKWAGQSTGSSSSTTATVTTQAGTSYTLSAADTGTVIVFTSNSAITVTVPTGLGEGFQVVLVQKGSGQITASAGVGVTLSAWDSALKSAGVNGHIALIATAANALWVTGNVTQ